MPDQDYTIDDIARILQIHRKTAERLVTSGALEGYKIGRVHRVTHEALDKFRAENKVKPKREPKSEEDLLTVA